MSDVRIDPEFRDLLPALTAPQYEALKEEIRHAGRIYQPIVLSEDVILDGHNRFKICGELGVEPHFVEAPDWVRQSREAKRYFIITNQTNRRNLTEEQFNALIVQAYELVKAFDRSAVVRKGHQTIQTEKNEPGMLSDPGENPLEFQPKRSNPARAQVAADFGVGEDKVRSEVAKAAAVKAVSEVEPGAAEGFKPTVAQANAINRAAKSGDPEQVKAAFAEAKKPKAKPKPKATPKLTASEASAKVPKKTDKEKVDFHFRQAFGQITLAMSHCQMGFGPKPPKDLAEWVKQDGTALEQYFREVQPMLSKLNEFAEAMDATEDEEHVARAVH